MMPRPSRLALFLVSVAATLAARAALTPTEWEHTQTLAVTRPGLVRVDLPPSSFDLGGPGQESLRIVDSRGEEVASLLDLPPPPAASERRPQHMRTELPKGATRLVLTTGTTEPIRSITLWTNEPDFVRTVTVEASDDGLKWTTVEAYQPIFRRWGMEQLNVPADGTRAAYLRLVVADRQQRPLLFAGAELLITPAKAAEPVTVAAEISRREEFSSETVLTIALAGRNIPLSDLTFESSDPAFMRPVSVTVRDVQGALPIERTLAAGVIYRIDLAGVPTRSRLVLPVFAAPASTELLVHIRNGDSPPMTLQKVTAHRQPVNLLFVAPAAGKYALLSGNPQAGPPHYDLAALAADLRQADAEVVVPGEPAAMPNYQPRETLGAPPMPDLPLNASPLDTSEWKYRRTVTLTRSGIEELELDPQVLAKAQPKGFGDLRIMQDGKQLPYVVETPGLSRPLTPILTAISSADHPTRSRWKLTFPEAAIPVSQIIVDSSTPLFQREMRLFEAIKSAAGEDYENALASQSWRRAPDGAVSRPLVFPLSGPLHSDTLWIETENGDNPPIVLETPRAIYPVVRLIFKVDSTQETTLVYGNPLANAPQYDLSLVAARLLTASRVPASLGAAIAAPATPAPFLAGLNGGVLFWAVLSLVVVVLLAVVAKLMPKPPAP